MKFFTDHNQKDKKQIFCSRLNFFNHPHPCRQLFALIQHIPIPFQCALHQILRDRKKKERKLIDESKIDNLLSIFHSHLSLIFIMQEGPSDEEKQDRKLE